MEDLLARAIAARSGFDRSHKFNKVTAAVVRLQAGGMKRPSKQISIPR